MGERATFGEKTAMHIGCVTITDEEVLSDTIDTVQTVLKQWSKEFTPELAPPNTYANKLVWTIRGDFNYDALTVLKQVFASASHRGQQLTISKNDTLFKQARVSNDLRTRNNQQDIVINAGVLALLFVLLCVVLYSYV